MKKVFLLLICSMLFAKEGQLESLLKTYEEKESLYHKTKIESAGHLIIYSRKDLERMQAYRLKDVLKTIPLFSLETSRLGENTLTASGASPMSSTPIKLYIDDHEYPSDLRGNLIYRYGEMPLYFIDHIEIYQGGTSIAFGNEVGSMVIRIYTKKSAREDATFIQTIGSSRGDYSLSAFSAKQTKNFDYLIFANNANDKYKKYKNQFGNTLSRDDKQQQVHMKFYKDDDWSLDIDFMNKNSDPFIGLGQKPISGTHKQDYSFVGFTKNFSHKIKLIASSSKEYSSPNDYDDGTIRLFNGKRVSHLSFDVYNISNKVQLEKRTIFDNDDLLLGVQLINKQAHIGKLIADGVEQKTPDTPKKMNIFMLYAENSYNFNKDNLVTFSGKLDHYDIDKIGKSNQHSLRMGYIGFLNKKTNVKVFAVDRYGAPRFNQTSLYTTYKANPKLDVVKIKMLSSELNYKLSKKSTLDFTYGYMWMKDIIVFSQKDNMYINQKAKVHYSGYSILYGYHFDIDNKINIRYFEGDMQTTLSPSKGVIVELFNTYGKFDFYNELLYRNSYTTNSKKVNSSCNYTLASTYRYSKQLTFKLKGENLFNNSSEVYFPDQGVYVQSIDRKIELAMEYMF